MKPAAKKAYLSFLYAEATNGIDSGGQENDLTDYKLPTFETWTRQLRIARKATGEQKYTPRTARSSGKSVVDVDVI